MFFLLLVGGSAQALELGRPQTLSGLGQALWLKIPVRLDPGETLRSDCIQIALQAGEQDIAPARVTKTVEWQADKTAATIWVRTAEVIDEPVVKLSLGCPRQQLTVFVDPAPAAGRSGAGLALPQAASAAGLASSARMLPTTRSDNKPTARLRQITLPDAEQAGLHWRFDLGDGRGSSSPSKKAAALRQKTPSNDLPAFSLLMAIDVGQTVADRPAMLDGERIQRAQVQFAALQRQQQNFSAEMDSLLSAAAQQESEQSNLLMTVLGVAVALLLLVLGLLWLTLSKRRQVKAQR